MQIKTCSNFEVFNIYKQCFSEDLKIVTEGSRIGWNYVIKYKYYTKDLLDSLFKCRQL